MSAFDFLFFLLSIVAGALASVTGFGIGSILTPFLALQTGTKAAVAAISVPHFVATFIRLWMTRRHIDRRVLLGFGVASAAGGLAGALLHSRFESPVLTVIFGVLLLIAGFTGFTGLAEKIRFRGPAAWMAGVLSGMFGGLVGNQGGIRSGALMGFELSKSSLVATATAVGVMVDLARVPVYLISEHASLRAAGAWIWAGTLGVTLGTGLGIRLLDRVSERIFRKVLGALVSLLGIYVIFQNLI